MKSSLVINAILGVFINVSSTSQSDIIVKIQQGYLGGTTLISERSNKTFFAFMGIPYAKPPVKNLRFKSPQIAESWQDVRNATVEGSVCPQIGFMSGKLEGEENCLFLNVFTPMLPAARNFTLKAVIVYIHGGAFYLGSGNRDFCGPDYLLEDDVVFVTINYRLGALGFLSLKNKEVPGNAGLKDQVLALQWVQKNIKEFGGDPNKVTIAGESAGAASVHYHLLSPLSKGLFHHAISQSGSALNPWSFCTPESNLKMAFVIGQKLGVETSNSDVLLEHLKTATVAQLVKSFSKMDKRGAYGFAVPVCPTIDTEAANGDIFLPDMPINLITSGKFHDVPYISGVTSHEGMMVLHGIKRVYNLSVEANIEQEIAKDLDIKINTTESQEAAAMIKDLYFGNNKDSNATLLSYIDFATDLYFFNGVYCAIKLQADLSKSPVYTYEFSYNGKMSVFKIIFGGQDLPGAAHADDVPYLFPKGNVKRLFSTRKFEPYSSELETSKRMVKMWTNFAKTGNPTPQLDPLLQHVTWNPVTMKEFSYLSFDSDLRLQHGFKKKNVEVWGEIYRKYGNHSGILGCWNLDEPYYNAISTAKMLSSSPVTFTLYILFVNFIIYGTRY